MQVYLVGGAVRDGLLGRAVVDKDFVVVGATPDQMIQAGFLQVGADFPVFLHPKTHQEYALARTERKRGFGYLGFEIYASPDVSLEADLKRRDLTINAMAIEVQGLFDDTPVSGEIIDPYGGVQDLQNRCLRHVSEAFAEDPLRVLRVARFLGRYYDEGFKISDETLDLMKKLVAGDDLAHLSDERIWQESERASTQANPQIYWQTLWEIGALAKIFPPLDLVWQQDKIRQHALSGLALADKMNATLHQKMAIIFYSFYSTLHHSGRNYVHNHVHNSAQFDAQFLGKFAKMPKSYRIFVQLFLQFFEKLLNLDQLSATQLMNLLTDTHAQKTLPRLQDLISCVHICQLSAQHELLKTAVDAFNQVSIKDLDAESRQNLRGYQIGQAINQIRLQKIEQIKTAYDLSLNQTKSID